MVVELKGLEKKMNSNQLADTAQRLVANHKGLLAADESTGTIAKRLETIGIESTIENRRDYREILFRTKGLGQYISGTILYDETIRQNTKDGTPLINLLVDQEIMPGIKVDTGAKALAGTDSEKITEGLDGLSERVSEYVGLGAKFAKWRAVIGIGSNIPSDYCINVNAHALARYARICQEGGLVPIVEPEVLMDGNHTIERCAEVTEMTLHAVFSELQAQGVELSGIILKPNMVISGKECTEQANPEIVATRTLACFERTVPGDVPGIMFLSGGQSEALATLHLNAINASHKAKPWVLSYSYGRALQESALKTWGGDKQNITNAQDTLLNRARLNSAACAAQYTGEAA